jgi:hypothetical protein
MSILSPSIFGGASFLIHLVHLVYLVFWTWVLNLICKAGYKWISWVLVLAPFVLAFFIVAYSMNADVSANIKDEAGVPVIVLSS